MDTAERIFRFNAGRDPDLLALKFARIASDPFLFLRGTCHLFYEDWRGGRMLDAAPRSWICGDLHLENLGSYKGENRLSYFDLNDFDEAALAPCTWEIARFLVSLHVASGDLGLRLKQARALSRSFLDGYTSALVDGKARWIERDLAGGMIGALLEQVGRRKRRDFLDRRTVREGKRRRFALDGDRLLAVAEHERNALLARLRDFAEHQSDPKFFRPLDVARRASGTGSLGLRRYAVLVRGKGSPNENVVLDMKLACASSAGRRMRRIQPRWDSEAQRIVTIQQRVQAIAPAFLAPLRFAQQDFVLKELQPSQDRLDLATVGADARRLGEALDTMGRIVAWSALRGSGRQGAASADDLVAFAQSGDWAGPLMAYVEDSAAHVIGQWKAFRAAWRQGSDAMPTRSGGAGRAARKSAA